MLEYPASMDSKTNGKDTNFNSNFTGNILCNRQPWEGCKWIAPLSIAHSTLSSVTSVPKSIVTAPKPVMSLNTVFFERRFFSPIIFLQRGNQLRNKEIVMDWRLQLHDLFPSVLRVYQTAWMLCTYKWKCGPEHEQCMVYRKIFVPSMVTFTYVRKMMLLVYRLQHAG